MADAEFWRDLAEQFRAVRDPHQLLRANWKFAALDGQPIPEIPHWDFSNSSYPPSRTSEFEFVALARRGGIRLNATIDSLDAWLEALRAEEPDAVDQIGSGRGRNDGRPAGNYEFGSIGRVCYVSADYCKKLESKAIEDSRLRETQPRSAARSDLRDAYLGSLIEKIKILDICWAAEEHYREWKRWLQKPSPLKDGSKPDRAFRAILSSGKRPLEYRAIPRPTKWE